MKRVWLWFLLLAAASSARADWVGPFAVGKIEVGSSGIYFFRPAGVAAFPNTLGCTSSDWVFIDGGSPLANRALAVALSAQAQGKTVNFYLTGCSGPYLQATGLTVNTN